MSTDTKMELSVWEKLTDSLSNFSEGVVGFIGRMFGSSNDRIVKSLGYHRARAGEEHAVLPNSLLAQVNAWEDDMRARSDDDLKGLTVAYRERLAAGETLEDLLPEAFAACREAARRSKNMRHFDVQVVGGVILHRGMIAEMVTGEGKTLVATMPAFLNALDGKGIHIITVNDYLARRDCEWMSPIFLALGLTCGYIQSDMEQSMGPEARRKAYDCDITYGTNSEFGFDYLRDNMKPARWGDTDYAPQSQQAQRALHYAIIDEVDNILIDEARTPLIISGESQDDPKLYEKANQIALDLTRLEKKAQEKLRSVGHGVNIPDHPLMQGETEETEATIQDKAVTHGTKTPETTLRDAANDEEVDQIDVNSLQTAEMEAKQEKRLGYYFEVKEKERSCHLTDEGIRKAEELAGVESFYTAGNMEWPHLIDNALKAHHLYHKDKNYVVMRNPEPPNEMAVIIVDEFTGRLMLGRQWSDGLHQAVEAKHSREGVKIKKETQTLATVTLQNFFRLYKKLAGMTGTAMTEANEFWKIYKREVVAIPTNKPLTRINFPDVIYLTEKEKWDAVVDEIERVHRYDAVTLKDKTELFGVIKTESEESLEIELKDTREKRTLAADQIDDIDRHGRPVLIGTTDVKKSEKLSALLKRRGIKHELLNAKPEYADREAEIVAQAGRVGAVTLSTNMAGRGTDIILGGNAEYLAWARLKNQYPTRLDVPPETWKATVDEIRSKENMEAEGREIAEMGGLHVIGTERHESRRIDNQLRGRAGRQGDPGSGRFFVSLQDDLMRIFAGEWVANVLTKLGMEPGQAIESNMVSRRIEAAQKKVEEHNFDIRKNLLEYDEVMDYQRRRVYGYRQEILEGANCRARVWSMIEQQIDAALGRYLAPDYGPASFAELVQQQLSVECEAAEFKDCRFDEAERVAKSRAEGMVPTQIQEAMDENLDDEVDPREWNWQAMADRVNRLWSLNMTAPQLKKIGRDNVSEQMMALASRKIDAIDLDKGKLYLQPDWGVRSLCSWFELKFQISIDPSKFELDLPRAGVRKILIDQVAALYRHKEVEFPVKVAMARFMADHGGSVGQRYHREGLHHWYLGRFGAAVASAATGGAGVTEDEFRTDSRAKLQEKLLDLSAKTLPAGGHDEIDQKLHEALEGTKAAEEADAQEIADWAKATFNLEVPAESLVGANAARARNVLCNAFDDRYRPEMKRMERSLLLNQVDLAWKAHLLAIDHLRQGIGLVSYAQIDPKSEFKRLGMKEFDSMWEGLGNKTTDIVFRIEDDEAFAETVWSIAETRHESAPQLTAPPPQAGGTQSQSQQAIQSSQTSEKRIEPIRNFDKKVGRNEPCPCGSGKKYKNCHMRTAAK